MGFGTVRARSPPGDPWWASLACNATIVATLGPVVVYELPRVGGDSGISVFGFLLLLPHSMLIAHAPSFCAFFLAVLAPYTPHAPTARRFIRAQWPGRQTFNVD